MQQRAPFRPHPHRALATLCATLFPVLLSAAEIELVSDFNTKGGGITEGAVLDGWLYFAYNDGETGIELWRTDGTAANTELFLDIQEGPVSATPRHFAVVDGTLWFSADGGDGHELWLSDGTTDGTKQVADINPSGDSDPGEFGPVDGGVLCLDRQDVHADRYGVPAHRRGPDRITVVEVH